ncbi:PREDICTED: dynein light chain roadblock-type 2-like [Diuraphis noxia]|uniref:dynein light chain roadblock-type 2-like n=1 Tax=Diuraphis noxia TaxID=143948 RepID=UPI000763A2EE|nr:PREDICTED: dynein light chain roadblock-type 2-like [Diuraphis noxia]
MNNVQHEFEETLKRIQSQNGVIGVIVVNNNGDLITSTLDNRSSVNHAEMIMKLADNAKGFVRNLDPSNELTVLRMGSKRREVLVAPGKDFIIIVLQKQNHKSIMKIIANSL